MKLSSLSLAVLFAVPISALILPPHLRLFSRLVHPPLSKVIRASSGFFEGSKESVSSTALSLRAPDETEGPVEPPAGTMFKNVRGYNWDEKHKNSPDKTRVKAAWDMAMTLAEAAVNDLGEFDKRVQDAKNSDDIQFDKKRNRRNPNDILKRTRQYVALSEPAYTQLFGADLDQIITLRDNFKKIADGVQNKDSEGRNNHLIYLTAMSEAKDHEGNDNCKNVKPGMQGVQAFVVQAKHLAWVKEEKEQTLAAAPDTPPDDAYVMNFCEEFFKSDDLTSLLEDLKKGHKDICNLGRVEHTTARIILHEWTHLDYTLDTNSLSDSSKEIQDDWVGFEACSSRSTGGKSDEQPSRFQSYSSKNADSYAQFALYHYMNSLDECKGVRWSKTKNKAATECAADVWPQDIDKFVRNTWSKYVKGD